MKEIIKKLEEITNNELEFVIFSLLKSGKLSFNRLAELYVAYLEQEAKTQRIYNARGAIALDMFRPNGVLKGKHTMKNPDFFAGGMDGFIAKALLFMKHSQFYNEEYIDAELAKINPEIVADEQNRINAELKNL